MHPTRRRLGFLAGLVVAVAAAGCSAFASPSATALAIPAPTCGGAKVAIPGALPCERLAGIALATLRAQAPGQLDRGVIAVDVELQGCPREEVPQQLDCTGEDWVQLVTVTFGPSAAGGPIEASLAVGIAPVSGNVLGIVNPLIR